jgi:hypothetical protein
MSEQPVENIVAQSEVLALLLKQRKDDSPESFETDLKNPEKMSRDTYSALSLLLIDDKIRASAGLETVRLTRDQKTEIKRICRASEFIFLQGLGVMKKRPIDPETGKPIPPPPREPRQDRPFNNGGNGKYQGNRDGGGHGNKHQGGKGRDMASDATRAISSGPYKGPKKGGQDRHDRYERDDRRERAPVDFSTEPPRSNEPVAETTLTDKVINALNANENISDSQRRTNDQGCREPKSMVKTTAQALLALRKKQSNGHDMQGAFLVKGIDEIINASPWKTSEDRTAIIETN